MFIVVDASIWVARLVTEDVFYEPVKTWMSARLEDDDQFLDDLVDEFWLKVFPVTLGMGKRLFGGGTIAVAYTLVDSKTSPNGA
jgi:hypothetical protein